LRDTEKGGPRVVLAQVVDAAVKLGVNTFPALFELLETFILIAWTWRHDEKRGFGVMLESEINPCFVINQFTRYSRNFELLRSVDPFMLSF
jgi:hypothetical protein